MIKHELHIVSIFIAFYFLVFSCNKTVQRVENEKESETAETLVEVNRILIKKDQQKIQGFIERMNWDMKETDTGLWYEILEQGEGDSIETNNQITMEYKVSLLDGTECYNSNESGNKTFVVGYGNIESGLEQGVLLLKNKSRARFIIPPHLAHGLTGDGNRIPARAILIYEVFIVSLSNS